MKNSAHSGMKFPIALFALIFQIFLFSCVSNNTPNQNAGNNSNTANIAEKSPINASDDAEELARIVKLPLTPEEVSWVKEEGVKLTAVLKFSNVDSDALISQAQKIAPPAEVSLEPEEWFPAELIAQSETTGDQSLKGRQYDARDFLQAPYTKGRLIKLEQPGVFVLELTVN